MVFDQRKFQISNFKFQIKRSLYVSVPLWLIVLVSPPAYAESVDIPSLFASLQVEGDPSTVWFEKGKVLYKLKAYSEAAEAFSKTGKDAPQDMIDESLYLRANSLMKIGDYSEALAVVNLIPVKSRFYIYGLYTKAMIGLHSGREKEAIEYLDQGTKNFPGPEANLPLKAHLTLGFIYVDSNNPAEAIKHLSTIPRDSPFYTEALFGSGWAYANMGRWVRAVVFWEELSSLHPESKYTREVIPYIGYAYTTLSAYGKALEQNGIALRYYKDMLKRLSDAEKEIRGRDIKGIARTIDMIGDKELSNELDVYNGLLSMEEYLGGIKEGISYETGTLIEVSQKRRGEIIEGISERLTYGIGDLRRQLLEASVSASLEIARNLRLEGGGQISNDMIFNGP